MFVRSYSKCRMLIALRLILMCMRCTRIRAVLYCVDYAHTCLWSCQCSMFCELALAHLFSIIDCSSVCGSVLLRGQVRRRRLGARSPSEGGLNLAPSNRQLDWHRRLRHPWLKHVGLDFQPAVSVADHVEPDTVLVCYWCVKQWCN